MRTFFPSVLLLVMSSISSGNTFAQEDAPERFRAGVAVAEITPPIGYRMSGYFHERSSTGTHDPLRAKALVFTQNGEASAIVCCDIVGIAPPVAKMARKLIAEQHGIPSSRVMISATHSHTGPLYFGVMRDQLKRIAMENNNGVDPLETIDYQKFLAERISRAVGEAKAKAEPVTIASGTGEQFGLSFNRRFHMKDGTVRFNPGRRNPNIVREAGPIDPEVGVLAVRSTNTNAMLAVLTVFALHLDTVGGTEYSADYPFYLEREVQSAFGSRCVSLFAAGTCGDINHIDVRSSSQPKGQAMAMKIGTTLGETVVKTARSATVRVPDLKTAHETITAPLQTFTPERIAEAERMMPRVGDRKVPFLERVATYKIIDIQSRKTSAIDLEVQTLQLADDLAIVTLPGEVFVDIGLAIKQASPYRHTFVIELTNDAPGYLPTKKAFREGSYETVNSRVQPGEPERMRDAAIRLLKTMHRAANLLPE